jgi:glycosyltransferase involved in cell wall biosynthesis
VKYYDSDDEDALAENIVLLRKNPELRRQQVNNALNYVEAHSWDVEKYQYLGIVDSLVAKEPVLQPPPPAPLEPCAIANSKTNQG